MRRDASLSIAARERNSLVLRENRARGGNEEKKLAAAAAVDRGDAARENRDSVFVVRIHAGCLGQPAIRRSRPLWLMSCDIKFFIESPGQIVFSLCHEGNIAFCSLCTYCFSLGYYEAFSVASV